MEQKAATGTAEMEMKALSLETAGALGKSRGSATDELIRQYTALLQEIARRHRLVHTEDD